jgi:hypothetical protein
MGWRSCGVGCSGHRPGRRGGCPLRRGCLGQRVLGYADQSQGDVDVWQECGRAPAAGSPESRAFPCEDLLDLGHYVARAFGSKFRAITRAITPGHPGEVMVTHGPSKEGDALHPRDKAAGQRPSDLQFCGGQGRGRTADLPISPRTVCESRASRARVTREHV